MKHIFALILAMLLAVSGAALANTVALDANGAAYAALNGLLQAETLEQLTTNPVHSLQLYEDTLFFVESTPLGEVIRAIGPDGSIREVAGPQVTGVEPGYDKRGNLISFNQSYGYSEMVVYDGYIYYVGTEQTSGSYTVTNTETGEVYAMDYTLGAAVYRMPVHGGYGIKLISGLGNGPVRLAIANNRIAVTSSFRNPAYAYEFTNFMLCDMDGNTIRSFENTAEANEWLAMDGAEFFAIVNTIQTDGETIYASLGDSEGDFASSRLVNVENMDEVLAYEAFYVPAIVTEEGILCLTTDVKDVFYEDGMEDSARIEWISGGETRVVAEVPAKYATTANELALLDGNVYLFSGENLLRVPLEGGELESLMAPAEPQGNPGIATMEITNDELLPESDDRLIGKDELEGYDKETLALMRNEILARHGYPFKKDVYRAYFATKEWYIENPDFDYNMLSSIEMENVETIKKLEGK